MRILLKYRQWAALAKVSQAFFRSDFFPATEYETSGAAVQLSSSPDSPSAANRPRDEHLRRERMDEDRNPDRARRLGSRRVRCLLCREQASPPVCVSDGHFWLFEARAWVRNLAPFWTPPICGLSRLKPGNCSGNAVGAGRDEEMEAKLADAVSCELTDEFFLPCHNRQLLVQMFPKVGPRSGNACLALHSFCDTLRSRTAFCVEHH
jgi:hypothetical protein